jgi:hypothetical protein
MLFVHRRGSGFQILPLPHLEEFPDGSALIKPRMPGTARRAVA